MTKEQLASVLNGREYGSEISSKENEQAREAGLVVVFGYSDDCVEFRGAFNDEVGLGTIRVSQAGVLQAHESDRCDCPFCGYEAIAAKCAVKALRRSRKAKRSRKSFLRP